MRSVRLRHIAQVNPPCRQFDRLAPDAEVTFLPMEAVWPDHRLDLSRVRTKDQVVAGYTRFQDGDVLVPKITPTFEASRSVIVRDLTNGLGAGTTELHVLRTGPDVDSRFLYYIVNTQPFLSRGSAQMYGVAGQKRVPEDFIRDYVIELPSLDEQRRIADFLDTEIRRFDQARSVQSRVQERLLERRAANIHSLVTASQHRDQRASGLPWVPMLPTHWQVIKLSYLARMGSGHTPSRSRPEWWMDCTIPWITTGEVSQVRDDRREVINETRENMSSLGLANSAAELHPRGTVVLCRTAASAGYSAVMGTAMPTSQDFVTWTCGPRIDPFYLLWCLRAMRPSLLGSLAIGSTHKTIYLPDLQMLRVPVPPVNEQYTIVERIRTSNEKLDMAVDAIDRQLQLLGERRQSLITALVTRAASLVVSQTRSRVTRQQSDSAGADARTGRPSSHANQSGPEGSALSGKQLAMPPTPRRRT